MRSLIAAVLLLGVCVSSVRAQAQGGSVTGTITDRLGGAVGDAVAQIAGEDLHQTSRTGRDGQFRFLNVPEGEYRLTLFKPGFERRQFRGLLVRAGETLLVTAVLDIEGVQHSVNVPERLRAAGAGVSFTHQELSRIPVPRSVDALITSVPGVVADRVNVGGSESHHPPQFVFRGTRMLDTVWTIDGVSIGDRQTGALPGIYDLDAFDRVQFGVPSDDITRQGSGLGVNLIVRSGTNHLHATARGYFSGDRVQASNAQGGLTGETADRTRQVTDYGADAGGPLHRGRAWFWTSAAHQDVRVFRLSGGDERTVMRPTTVKVNWRATSRDAINWLWLDHDVDRFGVNPSAFRAPVTARQNQSSRYPDAFPRGLWKVEDERTFAQSLFIGVRYAYYRTGTESLSIGNGPAAVRPSVGETAGATFSSWTSRPQHSTALDGRLSRSLRQTTHEFKFGGGWQRTEMFIRTQWPGDGLVAFDVAPTDQRARIYREQDSRNRLVFVSAYVSDTVRAGPVTIDVGVRYDHQRGHALPSTASGNPAFPDLVPAIQFQGDVDIKTWNDLSPRANIAYAMGDDARTIIRGSVGRYTSQLVMGAAAQHNPAHATTWIEYPWQDDNGDRLVQPHEVRIDLPYLAFEGMNPLDRSSPAPASSVDPALESRLTLGASVSIERKLTSRLTGTIAYHYARHTNWPHFRWRGLTETDYGLARTLIDVLPDGTAVNIPLYVPDAAKVQGHGSERVAGNHGYYSTYHGLETSLVRRMSNSWTMSATGAWNNSRSFYPDTPLNSLGNPTRLDGSNGATLSAPADPLVQGGQVAPVTTAPGGGGAVFLNSRWQLAIHGAYRLPWSLEFGGNLVGRQGTPSPYMVPQRLGLDGTRSVLVSPRVDSVRLDTLWSLDLRLAKRLQRGKVSTDLFGDLFNVLNSGAVLLRERNLRSPNFDLVRKTVHPRILRIGLRVTY